MKIVIDTNIILSALLSKNGVSNRLLIWLFNQNQKHNVLSNTLVTEFEAVLTRKENLRQLNSLTVSKIKSFIDDICFISYHQDINFLWRPFLKDNNDDMVLEVAFNAQVNFIITHNIKDFKGVKEYFNIEVMTPKEFLIKIGEIS